jgi:hypothetical protein
VIAVHITSGKNQAGVGHMLGRCHQPEQASFGITEEIARYWWEVGIPWLGRATSGMTPTKDCGSDPTLR